YSYQYHSSLAFILFTCSMRIMDTPLPILAIGHRFNTMQELRIACKHVTMSENFEFKVQQSYIKRYRIHCISSNGCPWFLHTSLVTYDSTTAKFSKSRHSLLNTPATVYAVCATDRLEQL